MKYLSLIFTLTVCACGPLAGTGTGNPISTSNGSNGSPNQGGVGTVSGNIVSHVCQMLEKCNPGMTDAVCGSGIMNLTSFAPKLGVSAAPAPTLYDIVTEEFSHQLIADPVAGDKCVAQMLKLECSDPVMQNSYVSGAAVPFGGTPDILDPVCAGVFTQ
jgi:hypothetical protein